MLTAEISTADTLVLDRFMNKQKPTIERETKPSTETANTPASTGTAWSKAPLLDNTNVLKALDAKLAISIGGLKADKITLGAMKVATSLSNGNLSINIPKFDFYGGTATTSVSVQPLGEHSLRISKNASVNNADIGEFLRHAAEFDRLDGRGNLTLSFTTQGISQDDFVNQLNGNGTLALKNGSIKGFNLAEIVRDAQEIVKSVKNKDITANMGNSASGAETDFSSLNASYTVNKGIINNPDLALQAPLLNLTGSGTVNLPQQTVNYRLKPTIVGSIEGEGRTQKTTGGLAIPMRVSGTFEQLKFTPDAQGLVQEVIKDPKGTLKNMEDNVRGLRDDVKSLFKGL
jgi:AsmA protein